MTRYACAPLYGALAALLIAMTIGTAAVGKTPGGVSCYRDICHRVRTIEETRGAIGRTVVLEASYYDDARVDRYVRGQWTSSGEFFDPRSSARVSSSDFPDGTELLLRNPENGRASHVRVNDFGPFFGTRLLDVTRRVAEDLGFESRGLAKLEVTVIAPPPANEPTYRLNRVWPAVTGYLGTFGKDQIQAMSSLLIMQAKVPEVLATAPAAPAARSPRVAAARPIPILEPIPAVAGLQPAEPATPRPRIRETVPTAPHAPADTLPLVPEPLSPPIVVADASPVAPPASAPVASPVMAEPAVSVPPLAEQSPPAVTADPQPVSEPEAAPATTLVAPLQPAPAQTEVALWLPPSSGAANSSGSATAGLVVMIAGCLVASLLAFAWSYASVWYARPAAELPFPSAIAAAIYHDPAPGGAPSPIVATTAEAAPEPPGGDIADEPANVFAAEAPTIGWPASRFDHATASLIPSDITIFGTVISRMPIILAGRVEGRISSPAVEVLAGARLDGDVDADLVDNSGTIDGRVSAGTLHLRARSELFGDAQANQLNVDADARLDANVRRA